MWRGHALALVAYGLAVVDEWRGRGHGDTTGVQIAEFALPAAVPDPKRLDPRLLPPWWGCESLHRSHRAALRRKDPLAYGWLEVEDPDEAYTWPPPPAPPAPERPFSAWLVRVPDDELERCLARGLVAVPTELTSVGATPKKRRQAAAFALEVRPGDPILVTDGAVLELGEVTGGPTEDGARPVAFSARSWRSDLERPWQLQDPRWLSRLRGEGAALDSARAAAGGT